MRLIPKNKKAGFEMSMTTIVVIVIAVVLLVLGLVFVRQIFGTATKSVSQVDLQVRNQLQKMLGEEGKDITIYSKEVSVKPGTDFTIAFGATNPAGGSISSLKYKVATTPGREDCVAKNGNIDSWFIIPPAINSQQSFSFDSYETAAAYGDLVMSIPKEAILCTQRISVILIYKDVSGNMQQIADALTLHVARGGII